MSPADCDKEFAKAMCMYVEGAVLLSIYKVALHFISKYIGKKVGEKLAEWIGSTNTALLWSAYKLYVVFDQTIPNIKKQWDDLKVFKGPETCDDLGFAKLEQEFIEDVQNVPYNLYLLYDRNSDGIYDLNCPDADDDGECD